MRRHPAQYTCTGCMNVGLESEFDRPEEGMWKFRPDCADSKDSTDGKGSVASSGGGGVRARCKGEALYALKC